MKKTITTVLVTLLCVAVLLYLFLPSLPSEDDLLEARQQGYSDGYEKGYEEGLVVGHDQGYDEGYAALKHVRQPKNGQILYYSEDFDSEEFHRPVSSITVHSSSQSDTLVSLRDTSGAEKIGFYVKAGESATVTVPAQWLFAYFASGDTWYGYGRGLMFGPDTSYSRDDEALNFMEYTYEYTLSTVYNGNFRETPSNEDEFFS